MQVKWNALWRLMRFDRPIGMLLLLWPTLWALWIAGEGSPSARNILIFCTGVVLMRAAGCIMNDVADRNFDPHVERTRSRPLASGELTVRQALITFAVVMALAFGLVLMTNLLTIKLAFAGAALASTYPFFKRWTHFPQVVLGLAFGWGIPMAFAAETGSVATAAWLILLINVVWSVIYDTLYAMVDREDDISIGLKSTAILFGRRDLLILRVLKVLMIALLLLLGLMLELSWPWFGGVTIAAVLFIRQQYQVRNRNREACFKAFLNNNWVGVAIWTGLFVAYLIG
jgi:4-hydroxybenzoate polyprenyltransferase